VLWFVHFFKPKRFVLLIVGGILDIGSSFYVSLVRNDRAASVGLLTLVIFLVAAAYLYSEARKLLGKMQSIFSVQDNPQRDLFTEQTRFDSFVKQIRSGVFSAREYLLVFSIPSFLSCLGFYQLLIQTKDLVDLARLAYDLIYWGLVFTICLSVVWAIVGVAISLNALGKEKKNLEISESIMKFKEMVNHHKDKRIETPDLSLIDFSFGRLKEAISPLANFLYMLAVKIAVFGFLISIPPILEFSLTGNILNLVYASSCAFTGVLSVMVYVFAQEGIYKIWSSSKDGALLVYEQLCEQVKHKCVGSIVSSQDPHARENLEKDVVFIRTTIDDLRRLDATKFNVMSAAKVAGTISLPLVTVIVSRLIK